MAAKQMVRIVMMLVMIACSLANYAPAKESIALSGAGATFPYPLYIVLMETFSQQNAMKITYDANGSGNGIKAITEKRVDFAGTDAFMTREELAKAGAKITHIPTCMGAVVVVYNLPGNMPIKFSPQVIADIFLGKITLWSDPRIAALNPGSRIPDLPISVVRRADGSGTTAIFTEYLSKVSPEWKTRVGAGKTVKWVTGQVGEGNQGVAGLVRQIMGSVGYVELIYAMGNNMKFAAVQNQSGQFIAPNVESVSLAGNVNIPEDTNISLTNTSAEYGYPISGFTWIALYQQQDYNNRPRSKAKVLVDFLWWLIHEGQAFAKPLHYGPLSADAVGKSEKLLQSIRFGADPLISKP